MGTTIQTGRKKNTKNYSNFSYFTQGIDVTRQNLEQFNPYIKGVARIFLYHAPDFMNQKGMFEDETANFKSYIETGYKKVDGIQDITVEFVDFTGGFNGQKFSNVASAKDDSDTLTISLYEQSGSPVTEYIDTWVNGVRDIRSGIAHYHGCTSVTYSELHHTAEFVFYDLDPTAKELEYACLWAHAFPANVSKSHYNYDSGDRGEVLIDATFRANKYESIYINQVAEWYRVADSMEFSYLDFNPNISQSDVTGNYALELPNAI